MKEDLAFELAGRYWGNEEALKVKAEFDHVFAQKGLPDDLREITIGTDNLTESGKETWLPQIIKKADLVKSTSEALRLIMQGGVKVNDKPVTDPDARLKHGEYLVKVGKRKFIKVIIR
jgi:tyrosyl-tRNA synthetase